MEAFAFAIGCLHALLAVLNGIAWMRRDSSENAFFCGLCAMYAILIIPKYWP